MSTATSKSDERRSAGSDVARAPAPPTPSQPTPSPDAGQAAGQDQAGVEEPEVLPRLFKVAGALLGSTTVLTGLLVLWGNRFILQRLAPDRRRNVLRVAVPAAAGLALVLLALRELRRAATPSRSATAARARRSRSCPPLPTPSSTAGGVCGWPSRASPSTAAWTRTRHTGSGTTG